MTPRNSGARRQWPTWRDRRVLVGFVASLALGIFFGTVVSALPAAAAPVGLSAPSPVDWSKSKDFRTIDGDPGGKFQWDAKTGRVRVGDIEDDDNHHVRGFVFKGTKMVPLEGGEGWGSGEGGVRAAGGGRYDEGIIPDYDPSARYGFLVCLSEGENGKSGWCNTSDTEQWPKANLKEGEGDDSCDLLRGPAEGFCRTGDPGDPWPGAPSGDSGDSGDVDPCDQIGQPALKAYCKGGGAGRPGAVLPPPPGGCSDADKKKPECADPSIKDFPDQDLPDGPAAKYEHAAEPVAKMLRWLVWAALAACVAGFIFAGANMAIKHKRSESGAHAAEVGWVLIASVVVGSGLTIYFIGLVLIPI